MVRDWVVVGCGVVEMVMVGCVRVAASERERESDRKGEREKLI